MSISVIIPTLNEGAYIAKTLRSPAPLVGSIYAIGVAPGLRF
jgi:glycosyltransferase involved in cell wall biosynthesis